MKLSRLEKRFIALAVALGMVLSFMPATKRTEAATASRSFDAYRDLDYYQAQDYDGADKNDMTTGDYKYREDGNGNVVITGYNGKAKKVEIPSTIGGKPVVCIYGAFKDNKTITDIVLPDSVTMIQYEAFYGAENLVNINLGSIQELGTECFYGCTNLGDLVFSDLSKTNYDVFGQAHAKSITITKDLGSDIRSLHIDVDKVVFEDGVTTVNDYMFGYSLLADTEIVWGDDVEVIGRSSFEDSKITSLKIPESVTDIEYYAFSYNSKLREASFSDNLVKVAGGDYGFMCGTLWYTNQPDGVVYTGSALYSYKGDVPENTTINVKSGTKGIGYSAFEYKNNITKVNLPEGLLFIGEDAFNGTGLKSVTIPNTVTEIGNYAFYDTEFTSVVIPKNVKTIGDMAFGYYYDYDNWTYGTIDGFTIIGYNGSAAQKYAKENGLKFVVAKDGIYKEDGELRYYRNNVFASNVTEVVLDSRTGKWYNVVKGKVVGGITAAKNANGWWYIDKDGKVDFGYSGLVKYAGSWWYVKSGKINFGYTGLCKYNGSWWYVKNGKVNFGYTGLCKYNGSWWYVKSGRLDNSYTGLCKYNGSWWYVAKGQVNFKYTGLCKYSGIWWYIDKGKLNFGYTGLCKYNGSWWYVKSGRLDNSYTGLCKYNGSWWYVKNGKVNFGYNGTVEYNGWSYRVKNGKVVF